MEHSRMIGIDMAKKKFDVWIPHPDASKAEHHCFPNDEDGFHALLALLEKDDVLGTESTGAYHQPLAKFFLERKFIIRELNPIMTKQFIRATVRKKKTDKTDAEIISRLLEQGEGYVMQLSQLNNPLKKLTRTKRQLIKMRSSLKIQLQTISKDKDLEIAREIYQRLIVSYDEQIGEMETEIAKHSQAELEILESVPGISGGFSRDILAELGDFERFDTKKQVVAYGGYDPKLKQSGMSNSTGSLTKRGSPYLRNTLYLAVFANLRSDTVFSRYYHKKKTEGKHHKQAMTATSRKMLEIIFALLQKKQNFSLDFS